MVVDEKPFRDTSLELCVRDLLADSAQLGVGEESRDVRGAEALELLNHHIPQLRAALAAVGP